MFRQGSRLVAIAAAVSRVLTVIKLGGSLLKNGTLPACLHAAAHYPGQIVLVPGGGVFADQVRSSQKQWHFDDLTAHRMAILAMQQMALLCHGIHSAFPLLHGLRDLHAAARITIWSPELKELNDSTIAASWDITSDSLAVWLAEQLSATKLILVKSCDIQTHATLTDLQQQGIIDAGFSNLIQSAHFSLSIVNQALFCRCHVQIPQVAPE